MKKIAIIATLAVLVGSISSKGASAITWGNLASSGNPGDPNNIVSSTGVELNNTHAAFLVLLVTSSDAVIDWNPLSQTVGAGETTIVSWNWGANFSANGVDGYLYRDLLTPGDNIGALATGSFVYTVIVNTGVNSLILDGPGIPGGAATALAVNPSSGIGSYDTTGNTGSTPYNWVAVPEPSTYAFLGLGAILLAIRRFRRS